jgi:hypothetical protein
MSEKRTKWVDRDGKPNARGMVSRRVSIVVPSKVVQEWLSEKAVLERDIALKRRALAAINSRLRNAGFVIRDDLPSKYDEAKPLAPVKRFGLIDAIEKIANESAHPISKVELRRRLVALGMPIEKFNNYFYQAIRTLRSRHRISVLDDGRVWRP